MDTVTEHHEDAIGSSSSPSCVVVVLSMEEQSQLDFFIAKAFRGCSNIVDSLIYIQQALSVYNNNNNNNNTDTDTTTTPPLLTMRRMMESVRKQWIKPFPFPKFYQDFLKMERMTTRSFS